jgi:uncharacterized protein YhhL (DUF1145 family)
MTAAKAGLLVVWAIGIGSFFIGGDHAIASAGRITFWLIGAAHLVEIVVFRNKLNAAPGGMAKNFLPTFLFGLFHVRSLD